MTIPSEALIMYPTLIMDPTMQFEQLRLRVNGIILRFLRFISGLLSERSRRKSI